MKKHQVEPKISSDSNEKKSEEAGQKKNSKASEAVRRNLEYDPLNISLLDDNHQEATDTLLEPQLEKKFIIKEGQSVEAPSKEEQ